MRGKMLPSFTTTVSVFAPELRAAVPVSPQRLSDLWKSMTG